jgi:putative alpha-1,2-mannosidase
MKKIFAALLICTGLQAAAQNTPHENLVQYVKPIIGTQRMGHTYPGATVPFGMVQLSPETDTASYELNGNTTPKFMNTAPVTSTRIKPL